MQNLCDLYKLYIFFLFWGGRGVPSSSSLGSPKEPLGFLEHESVHQYLHWRKLSKETTPCLCFHTNMSLSLPLLFWLTEATNCTFVCVHLSSFCQSPSLSANLLIYFGTCGWRVHCRKRISHLLAGSPNQSYKRTNHFLDLGTVDCSSWHSWQLIASRLPLVKPPSTELWLVRGQGSLIVFDKALETSQ